MNIKYLGRRNEKNEFGEVIRKLTPCVQITFKDKEASKFRKMMDWIRENYFNYDYDICGDVSGYTAYVEVSDGEDGAEFMSFYKEAKKAVN